MICTLGLSPKKEGSLPLRGPKTDHEPIKIAAPQRMLAKILRLILSPFVNVKN
jgi:hypothetical protein